MTHVVLALGANLGDRAANLREAVARLEAAGVRVLERSSIWETPPVPADQPEYLNAAVVAETTLAPLDLLRTLKTIERDLGRRPGRRWGPRPIDIDILFYGDESIDEPDLTIPHPRIAERAFVLAPLAEITHDTLPVLNRAAQSLLDAIGLQGATRTPETWNPA
jgi:2-amino-4-hydroxy-6-hydroxymethyldihydropteridine diphosphokinase